MKRKDVEILRDLLALKKQAASLKYKARRAEQQTLLDRSADCIRNSAQVDFYCDGTPSAGDLVAASRFQSHLRLNAAQLEKAARSMDELIETMREKMQRSVNRETAAEALVAEAEQVHRMRVNEKDETSREQITLIRRSARS